MAAYAGDGFSPRAEDAILHGCLPVVIMDDVDPIFAFVLDWESFSVRIPEVRHFPASCSRPFKETFQAFPRSEHREGLTCSAGLQMSHSHALPAVCLFACVSFLSRAGLCRTS